MVINVVCTLLKGCLLEMSIFQFLMFSILGSLLKLTWRFYNEDQKEATLRMIEKELFNLLLENEYGELEELSREIQELYVWLLNH